MYYNISVRTRMLSYKCDVSVKCFYFYLLQSIIRRVWQERARIKRFNGHDQPL